MPENTYPRARKSISRCALAFVAYTAVAYAIIFAVEWIFAKTGVTDNPWFIRNATYIEWGLSVLPMYLVGVPVLYLIVRKMPKVTPEKHTFTWQECLFLFLISRGFLIVGSLISTGLTALADKISGEEVGNATAEMIEGAPTFLVILVVVVAAPIIEELIFRKFLIDRLGFLGDKAAILISSVIFGLAHGNLYQFLYAFLLGLILGYLYSRSGRMVYNVGLHMVTNFLGSVVSVPVLKFIEEINALGQGMQISAEELPGFFKGLLFMLSFAVANYGLAIVGLVLFFMLRKKLNRPARECAVELTGGQITKAAILNVGSILFVLACLAEFVLPYLAIEF